MSRLGRHAGSSPATRGCHSASCRNMVPLDGRQQQNGTDYQQLPSWASASVDRGGVGQLPPEAEQLPHGVLAVGGLADPEREVVGRDRAQVAVISLTAFVAAVGRLDFQV